MVTVWAHQKSSIWALTHFAISGWSISVAPSSSRTRHHSGQVLPVRVRTVSSVWPARVS